MSLKATSFMSIPEETVRVARAAYPKSNRYLRLRDTFGPLFENEGFEGLFSREGRPTEEPARLAAITILQFAENLSDEQAAEQVHSEKRTTRWVGYKVFLTESCDADQPHLITNVATTSAPTTDEAVTPTIQAALERRDLLPALHLVDTGFIEAELICDSQTQYELDLCGPVRGDYRRQAREGLGFAAEHFSIAWEAQQATCPAGRTSSSWSPAVDRGHHKVIKIKFSERDCRACPHHAPCTDGRYRPITVRPKEQYLALQSARRRQLTPEFMHTYAARAGIEGTISQGTRSCVPRRARYIGLPKTHLQHLAIASAINLRRVADWLDDAPRARTRHSSFERLYRLAAQSLCLAPQFASGIFPSEDRSHTRKSATRHTLGTLLGHIRLSVASISPPIPLLSRSE